MEIGRSKGMGAGRRERRGAEGKEGEANVTEVERMCERNWEDDVSYMRYSRDEQARAGTASMGVKHSKFVFQTFKV
jgi:hypothetical protein